LAARMKKNRLIFYSVIGVLHLLVFLFTLYMDSQKDNLQFLVNLQKVIWLMKYAIFILLVLFVTNFILHMRDNKRHTRENVQLIQELNTLKAKLYDLQETRKTSEPNPPKPV
jgi:membrane protein YdbS with pleckstrin-like domain